MEHRSSRAIRNRRTTSWALRIALGFFALFSLVTGTAVGYFFSESPTLRQIVRDYRCGTWDLDKAFPGKTEVTLLFLGRDVDLDNHARVVDTYGRTDTILIARLNFTERSASILSIPRDTLVRIPGYHGKHKINAAHAFGGPDLTAQTIEQLLGIYPDEYVVVDYQAFVKAVDVLGGLELTVAKQMDYDDNWGGLHIHLKPGAQLLDGEQALGFVRYRRSNDGCGDTDQERIERQQQFLMAAKRRIASPSAFMKLPDVIETVHSGVSSSMTDAQMIAVAKFIRGLPQEAIRTAVLPGTEGRVYVRADEDATRRLIDEMF